MLAKHTLKSCELLETITLDLQIPENHLVRKEEAVIDSSFIYLPLDEEVYSAERGRPRIDPVVLIN